LFLFLLLIDRVVVVDYLRHHHSLVVGPVRIRLWWMDGWILLGVCMCIMLLLHSCTCFSCHMFHCLSLAFWRDLEIFLVCTTSVILQGVVKFLNSPLNASISSVFGSGWIRSASSERTNETVTSSSKHRQDELVWSFNIICGDALTKEVTCCS
jgi:hypothetical protein